MLYWDDLYHIDLDDLRHEYVQIATELEATQKENAELEELLTQRDNEINALKHMLDRKDEEQ